MKGLPWVLAGVGIGLAITIVVVNSELGAEPEYETGYDGVERAARKTFGWGTKTKAEGKVRSFAGAVKEGVGRFTGDQDLADEGTAERFVGDVKDAAGGVGHAVAETIHDLNR